MVENVLTWVTKGGSHVERSGSRGSGGGAIDLTPKLSGPGCREPALTLPPTARDGRGPLQRMVRQRAHLLKRQ
jgi:hypothetical protein